MRLLVSSALGALVVTGCAVEPAPDTTPLDCELPALGGGASTLAGCAVGSFADGARDDARFANPVGVARGGDGLVYVADHGNDAIRVADDRGAVRTLVQRIGFEQPFALTFGADGLLYASTDVDDEGEYTDGSGVIWRIDPAGGEPLVIKGHLGRPRGLLGLPDGRLAVADPLHGTIRLLDPKSGVVEDLTLEIESPSGLALLPDGRIAVADTEANAIRAVDRDGVVSTLAGTGEAGLRDGAADQATFRRPQALAVDARGALYVGDLGNFVVRKLDAGVVSTVVGTGEPGWADGAEPLEATLFGLEGLDVSPDGRQLWLADGDRGEGLPFHRVRVIEL